jgi:hypothetical protein
MFRMLILAATTACLAASAAAPTRAPILIELFTSEGCSSCPPADALLSVLDSQAVVLGEHVDYWDHQGWRDRFSSHANTLRQEAYARHFGIEGPYTPQMVIDGVVEFNGSDKRRALDEIERERARSQGEIRLARTPAGLEVSVDSLARSADVMLALAEDNAASDVAGGENKGRSLRHVSILRSLRKIGAAKKGAAFHQTLQLPAETSGQRVIVFAQEPDFGRVYAAAVLER